MVESVPAGGDAYLIKMVFTGESDERAIAVLRNCVTAMNTGGRVLVADIVLPAGSEPSSSRVLDLLMLDMFGRGRIRTEAEFRDVFAAAGLKLANLMPTDSAVNPISIMELAPV